MLNKKILVMALLAVSASSFAGPTLGEIGNINSELKKQELQNKLDEARKKGASIGDGSSSGTIPLPPATVSATAPAPVSVLAGAAMDSDELKLLAIYGVGKDLKAEVLYNGNTFTLSKDTPNIKLGSWSFSEVTPSRLILTKENANPKKGEKSKKEVFLSSGTTVDGSTRNLNLYASPSGSSNFSPSSGVVPLPPVPVR